MRHSRSGATSTSSSGVRPRPRTRVGSSTSSPNIDITDLAPQVTAPTLILSSRREPDNVFEQSRKLAALISGSRLVPLDSANHLLPAQDPAWKHFLAEVDAFLAPAQ
jgi:pimeloyl-ACP methyl ester carboxylesterase